MSHLDIKLDKSTITMELPAPQYRSRGGSSHRSASFTLTVEFHTQDSKRPESEPLALLTSLTWQNENKCNIMTMSGRVSPQMLYDLADSLPDIAARLERQQAVIAQLTL